MNPHVQGVQNMYGKVGQGVFQAELQPAEVYPRFDLCRVVNEPLQKKSLRQF